MKKEIELKLNDLEMQMEWFDTIESVQTTINELSSLLKNNKDKELQTKFDNLMKYFRKVYLGI